MTGFEIIQSSEGLREFAYPDPASDLARAVRAAGLRPRWGYEPARAILATLPNKLRGLSPTPWTCGYGETRGVTLDTRWSKAEALERLRARYREIESAVIKACTVQPTPKQLGAMVSLAYNIGLGWTGAVKPPGAKDGFRQSTVLRAHNRGDFQAAARAFALWNKANGRVEPALTRRRAEEAAIYISDIPRVQSLDAESMPQHVEPESNMSESPINRASVVAGGTAAAATVAETARAVADVKYSLGDWLVPVLLVAVVALCGYIIWTRYKQRKEGWA